MEKRMIAYCGLDCFQCPGYVATQSGDQEALKKVAAEWSAEFDSNLSVDDVQCQGCHSESGPWMAHCAVCKMRACGTEKGVANCAHCSDYACDKVTEFFGFVPEAKATLDAIRADL